MHRAALPRRRLLAVATAAILLAGCSTDPTPSAGSALPDLLEPHHGHGAAVVDGVAYVLLGGPQPTLSAGAVVERLRLGEGD